MAWVFLIAAGMQSRMSRLSTHSTSLTIFGNAVARGLLSAALAVSTIACRDAPSEQRSLDAATHATAAAPARTPVSLTSATPVMPRTPHAWALATTAIVFEFNAGRHDLLGGAVATPDGEEEGKRLLSSWWGVNTHDELLEMLNWLQFEGHRTRFDQLGRWADAMNEMQFESTKATLPTEEQQIHSLEVARKNYRLLGNKGILAWDLVRYIALCRWGYLAGYLSEMEAWDRIMPAASRLQQTFTSWQDLQDDYLIGRDFWSVEQTRETGDRFRAIYEHFIQDSSSPWNVNPWTMDLGIATPLPIAAP